MRLLTVDQVAEMLTCSRRHVGRMIEAGRLPATDIGLGTRKEWRIALEAVETLQNGTAPIKQPKRKRRKPANIIRYV